MDGRTEALVDLDRLACQMRRQTLHGDDTAAVLSYQAFLDSLPDLCERIGVDYALVLEESQKNHEAATA
jgi:hypothetical protein